MSPRFFEVLSYVLLTYGTASPVVYAVLAGRATQNLLDTDTWHYWSFRCFVIGLLSLVLLWFTAMPGGFCIPEPPQRILRVHR